VRILDEKRAPNPRRVRIFLAEKGISIPYEQVDIMTGAHKTPEFAEVNPVQRVPVLILDDGTAISETMAICRYFEATNPSPSRPRARVESLRTVGSSVRSRAGSLEDAWSHCHSPTTVTHS